VKSRKLSFGHLTIVSKLKSWEKQIFWHLVKGQSKLPGYAGRILARSKDMLWLYLSSFIYNIINKKCVHKKNLLKKLLNKLSLGKKWHLQPVWYYTFYTMHRPVWCIFTFHMPHWWSWLCCQIRGNRVCICDILHHIQFIFRNVYRTYIQLLVTDIYLFYL